MKSRVTAPLWLSAALLLGGALFTFGPSLLSVPNALADRPGTCSPRNGQITADDPTSAAALADAIWSNPDGASCILATHSMTPSTFKQLMTDIAADPVAAKTYAEARRLGRRL